MPEAATLEVEIRIGEEGDIKRETLTLVEVTRGKMPEAGMLEVETLIGEVETLIREVKTLIVELVMMIKGRSHVCL